MKKKQKYKLVRVDENTYTNLIFLKAQYETKLKKNLSFNDILRLLTEEWFKRYDR
jgi:hypothetical protein